MLQNIFDQVWQCQKCYQTFIYQMIIEPKFSSRLWTKEIWMPAALGLPEKERHQRFKSRNHFNQFDFQ